MVKTQSRFMPEPSRTLGSNDPINCSDFKAAHAPTNSVSGGLKVLARRPREGSCVYQLAVETVAARAVSGPEVIIAVFLRFEVFS